jgi:hypothetical protein
MWKEDAMIEFEVYCLGICLEELSKGTKDSGRPGRELNHAPPE